MVALVRARFPSVWVSVPATTRARHPAESADARVFVSRPAFERMIADGELVEWAELGGDLYGTPWDPIAHRLRAGRPVLLCLDLVGARQVRAQVPGARLVLLVGPSTDPDLLRAVSADPDRTVESDIDAVVVHDLAERAAAELVGLLGSSFLTPAQPRVSTARDVG